MQFPFTKEDCEEKLLALNNDWIRHVQLSDLWKPGFNITVLLFTYRHTCCRSVYFSLEYCRGTVLSSCANLKACLAQSVLDFVHVFWWTCLVGFKELFLRYTEESGEKTTDDNCYSQCQVKWVPVDIYCIYSTVEKFWHLFFIYLVFPHFRNQVVTRKPS